MIFRIFALSLALSSSAFADVTIARCDVETVIEENNIFEEGLGSIHDPDADDDSVNVYLKKDSRGMRLHVGQMTFRENEGDIFQNGPKVGFGQNVLVTPMDSDYQIRFVLSSSGRSGGPGKVFLIEDGEEKLMATLSCR